jgi:transposase InsO family protein
VIRYTQGRWCCWLPSHEKELVMAEPFLPLTARTEAQRAQALERFTIIRPALEDYSRAIAGYRISFQEATALTTALTLRTAIWRKDDPRWHVCGIPSVFYTDHGSDFTSKHMEQVAADLPMELIFSQVKVPRSRSKVERFFRSVNELFLQDLPGYAPDGYKGAEAKLTLVAFEQRFRTWLLEEYQGSAYPNLKTVHEGLDTLTPERTSGLLEEHVVKRGTRM